MVYTCFIDHGVRETFGKVTCTWRVFDMLPKAKRVDFFTGTYLSNSNIIMS